MSASAPLPPPTPAPAAPAPAAPPPVPPARGSQVALGVFLAVLLGLLAYRGYGGALRARPTEPVVAADLIDLNTADQKELAQVPGVGPKMAEAIVDHRRVHGLFKSVDELRSVRGVGPITFDKVRGSFRVSSLPPEPVVETPASPQPQTQAPAPAQTPTPRHATGGGAKKVQSGDAPINVNTATADELQRLPGVGSVMAQGIIAARTAAPFQSVNDLTKVKGIGPKTLEKLRPLVVVK
jgi:competence protein ComEA